MRKDTNGWLGALRSLGRAGTELLRSEIEAVGADLAASGASLTRAVALFLAAGAVVFWAIGAMGLLAIEVLALWLPRWSAALIVLVVLLLAVWILWLLAQRKLRQVERPAATVRRRVSDHVDWWHERVLEDASEPRDRLEAGGGDEEQEW